MKKKTKKKLLTHISGIWRNGTDASISRAGMEMQMESGPVLRSRGRPRCGSEELRQAFCGGGRQGRGPEGGEADVHTADSRP